MIFNRIKTFQNKRKTLRVFLIRRAFVKRKYSYQADQQFIKSQYSGKY